MLFWMMLVACIYPTRYGLGSDGTVLSPGQLQVEASGVGGGVVDASLGAVGGEATVGVGITPALSARARGHAVAVGTGGLQGGGSVELGLGLQGPHASVLAVAGVGAQAFGDYAWWAPHLSVVAAHRWQQHRLYGGLLINPVRGAVLEGDHLTLWWTTLGAGFSEGFALSDRARLVLRAEASLAAVPLTTSDGGVSARVGLWTPGGQLGVGLQFGGR